MKALDVKVPVTRSSMPPFEEYVEAIRPLWESRWLTNMGANHELLSRRLEEYLKVDNVSLFVNGHMALEMCIQAMGLKGEIITTPFTFISTTHAIIRNDITPVFCDIKEDDYTMDPDLIEDLITEKTTAIIPVHVYGNICDVKRIDGIAKKHGLKLIYDAAHAFGEELDGVGIGNFGDASMFSFHATKVYNTIEGGAICTGDDELIREVYKLKDFGIKDETIVDGIGANAKMNEFAAIMGLCNLDHIDGEIEKRKRAALRYRENLKDIKGISFYIPKENVKSSYSYFPIVVNEDIYGMSRDMLHERLKEYNVFTRKYFYPLTSEMECFKGRFDISLTPVAKRISESVLTLPMSASLDMDTIDSICRMIREMRKG